MGHEDHDLHVSDPSLQVHVRSGGVEGLSGMGAFETPDRASLELTNVGT